jgi:hypothetical protein
MAWRTNWHRAKGNRFGNQHFYAKHLYTNYAIMERQKRKCFHTAISVSTWSQIRLQENTGEQRLFEGKLFKRNFTMYCRGN